MAKMKWRKWNRVIHRDFGYFFFGMTIIYSLSGIALNHLNDWNPNFIIRTQEIQISIPENIRDHSKNEMKEFIKEFADDVSYKNHYFPDESTLKIFSKSGTITIDLDEGWGLIEDVRRRPVFHEVNYLHYNPARWWTWFSDIYAGALIVIAITGLFIIRGKNGIKRRGALLTLVGVIIPLIFLWVYLS